MYGIIPIEKTDILFNAPPENISKKPNNPLLFAANKLLTASALTPGIGIAAPIL